MGEITVAAAAARASRVCWTCWGGGWDEGLTQCRGQGFHSLQCVGLSTFRTGLS